MPIRFYTTSVDAKRTAHEMQQILAQIDEPGHHLRIY